ncbi:MAG: transaldolase family protein [Planctomycetota bacterium]
MTTALASLIDTGTKLWLDSVDPDEVTTNIDRGITGATSNPAIISSLIKSGRFDETMQSMLRDATDSSAAWMMCDYLVSKAQEQFQPIWERTGCNDGWVSFELDPLIEDPEANLPHEERVRRYISLGRYWCSGYTNRMIKVPATPAGLEAIETMAADGLTLNVTLIFTERQYKAARDAVWRGAQKRKDGLERFKSVYSIFISRVDVYTAKKVPGLGDEASKRMGLVNAKRLWADNEAFWADKNLKLQQEIIFASTGKKLDWQDEDYYPKHVAGGGIQTNPPETNDAIAAGSATYERTVDKLPDEAVLKELDEKVDLQAMEDFLMEEGIEKFAKPQKALLDAVKQQRAQLTS